MRAERDRRAAILNDEGLKQSQILTAEGEKQSSILRAEGQAQAAILRAQGEARAIGQVFEAIHAGDPDPKLLAYQYLQMLPQIAKGDANKLWIVPSELNDALKGFGSMFNAHGGAAQAPSPQERDGRPAARGSVPVPGFEVPVLEDPAEALQRARAEAAGATRAAEGAQRTATGGAPA